MTVPYESSVNKHGRLFISMVLLIVFPLSLSAITPIPSAREKALGDSHPALVDDFAAVFSNPAGIAVLEPVHRYTGIDLRLSGTFWNAVNAFKGQNPAELFPLENGNYLGFGLLGPIDTGYAGAGKAFRMFSYASIDVLYPNAAVQSLFTFKIGAEFTGGWAHRFQLDRGGSLDFGFTMKGFYEQRYLGEADVVEFFGLLTNPEYFLDMPYEVIPGIGIDTGLLVNIRKQWIFGLTVDDLLTFEFVNYYDTLRNSQEGLKPDVSETRLRLPVISVGTGWFPGFADDIPWFGINGFYLSFRHLLGGLETYPRNYLLGITAGAEITFWDFLALRAGFSQGLLSGGFGLRFGGFSMDLSIGGEELSNQPGVFSVIDLRLAFALEHRDLQALKH